MKCIILMISYTRLLLGRFKYYIKNASFVICNSNLPTSLFYFIILVSLHHHILNTHVSHKYLNVSIKLR